MHHNMYTSLEYYTEYFQCLKTPLYNGIGFLQMKVDLPYLSFQQTQTFSP